MDHSGVALQCRPLERGGPLTPYRFGRITKRGIAKPMKVSQKVTGSEKIQTHNRRESIHSGLILVLSHSKMAMKVIIMCFFKYFHIFPANLLICIYFHNNSRPAFSNPTKKKQTYLILPCGAGYLLYCLVLPNTDAGNFVALHR